MSKGKRMISPPKGLLEAKTERLVVMVSPSEKQDITERAKNCGMDTSEFVRSRCRANDVPDDMAEEELAQLTRELNSMAEEARTSLKEGLAAINATLSTIKRGKR